MNRFDLLKNKLGLAVAVLIVGGALYAGCGNGDQGGPTGGGAGATGEVDIDGSSTVEPISSAVGQKFQEANSDAKVTVAASGTGGGFKKFGNGEIDIAGASRPIDEKEIEACKKNGVEWIELPVAYDGLSILVNPANDFVTDLTVEELKKIWEPNSKVMMWSDVRPEWPKEKIVLYGPGTDSGTFEYFTEVICGKKKASRTDYQASEDDNVLVQGVAGDKYALGYFGHGYYEQNKDKLKLVTVNGVAASHDTILDGSYKPLSRPLFIYVNKKSMEKPAVSAYVDYYLTKGKDLVSFVGYVPLPDDVYAKAAEHAKSMQTGPSNLLSPSK